tara:strand:- start:952 stop:1260 length:309 start_codon:yes stop_codon:yes gene_type:complete
MKTIIFITFLTFLLTSCGSLKEAGQVLRNEKVKNTDEFLVKKKEPLILPPNYEKIPEPGSINKTETQDKDKIKKILKSSKTDQQKINRSGSIEKSIIDKIRK